MRESEQRRVLIYRNELLPRSETFIAAQASSLKRYIAYYCGLRKIPDGILPRGADPCLFSRHSGPLERLRIAAFLETGFAPSWRRSLRHQKPSLIHAHFAIDAACALPLFQELDLPLVVSLHGYDVTSTAASLHNSRTGRVYLRRKQALFERVHTFLCVSDFIRQAALNAGFPASKLLVHSIGIDIQAYQRRAPLGPSSLCEPLVLFVGRLVEKKGCRYLLHAMQIVQRTMPNARLVVIGDGPLKHSLIRMADALRLNHCDFIGAQPSAVVRAWLQQASVFSAPSITAANGDAEGLGMVFCEAQAIGVPVVSFASGGIPEAVAHGESGILVAERDEASLAAAILRLLSDQSLWDRMNRCGPKRIAELFNLTNQTEILEQIYDEVITGKSRRLPVNRFAPLHELLQP